MNRIATKKKKKINLFCSKKQKIYVNIIIVSMCSVNKRFDVNIS